MKTIFMVAIAVFFTTGILCAQEHPASAVEAASPEIRDDASQECDMNNCYIMKADQVFYVKDGIEQAVESNVKLENGTMISKDGQVMAANGEQIQMKSGECMTMNGIICLPPSNEKRVDRKK